MRRRFARVSEKLRRVPEVNLHNQACAHEAQIRVLAVLVSPRTPFSLFCRRLENVSILSSLLCWKLRLILDFPWTSRILIWISCILIQCLPPYIMKWIGLLMSVSLLNGHNRLASTCPCSNLSAVFRPSIKRKIGIREAITQQREKRLPISYLALKLGYINKTYTNWS